MKKVVFSAVALVAFSFAGMANNEVKEVEISKNNIAKKGVDCTAFAIASLEMLDPDITWSQEDSQEHILLMEAYCYLMTNGLTD